MKRSVGLLYFLYCYSSNQYISGSTGGLCAEVFHTISDPGGGSPQLKYPVCSMINNLNYTP